MQEETPLAPAQTISSAILLPQNFLQLVLDRRGRAACCSLSGVLLAGGTGEATRGQGLSSHQHCPTKGQAGGAVAWAEELRTLEEENQAERVTIEGETRPQARLDI